MPFVAGAPANSGAGARRARVGQATWTAGAGNERAVGERSETWLISQRCRGAEPRRHRERHASAAPKESTYSATRSSSSASQPKQVVHARVVSRNSLTV